MLPAQRRASLTVPGLLKQYSESVERNPDQNGSMTELYHQALKEEWRLGSNHKLRGKETFPGKRVWLCSLKGPTGTGGRLFLWSQ